MVESGTLFICVLLGFNCNLTCGACTRAAVVALHPNVAVVLCHPSLGVEEWKADAALGAQAGIVAAALLNGLLIELVSQSET